MKYNADGSPYSAESVAEIMAKRFEETRFPWLSDLLGSDWSFSLRRNEDFQSGAYRIARMLYPDDGGHLYPR